MQSAIWRTSFATVHYSTILEIWIDERLPPNYFDEYRN